MIDGQIRVCVGFSPENFALGSGESYFSPTEGIFPKAFVMQHKKE